VLLIFVSSSANVYMMMMEMRMMIETLSEVDELWNVTVVVIQMMMLIIVMMMRMNIDRYISLLPSVSPA